MKHRLRKEQAPQGEEPVPDEEQQDKKSVPDGDEREEEPAPREEPQEEEMEKDKNYGVYTADEVMQAKDGDTGLRKAAEILEEMTRNTAIMKKLASDMEEDDGTTDFPDFSCDADDGECSFRDGYATDSASAELSETASHTDE